VARPYPAGLGTAGLLRVSAASKTGASAGQWEDGDYIVFAPSPPLSLQVPPVWVDVDSCVCSSRSVGLGCE
jgi:hypothetical protein